MITDTNRLAEHRKEWAGVDALRSKLKVSAFASAGIGGRFPFALADAANNLPFMHAFGVLNDILLTLRDEGHFECKSNFLGALLAASETSVPWTDFATIKKGVGRRNDVAHRADLLGRGECWEYVDAIKAELSSWGVV